MDPHQQYPVQSQYTGSDPVYYAPPAEKTDPMHATQYSGNNGMYQSPQYQTQPENGYGAPGSQYIATDAAYAPTNEGSGGPHAAYGGTVPAGTSQPKRTACISMLAAIGILVALVIGLSAGLGVSQNKLHTAQTDLSNALSILSAATASATAQTAASATATTNPSTTSSSTGPLPTSNIDCPKTNATMYTASNGDKFEQFCGIDYSGDGATDLASTKAISMDACMDACADKKGCQGAGWGYLAGDKSLNHTCYMKTNLTQSHSADSSWAFGVLLTS